MKQRILVMNGQRLIENQVDGKWKTIKVTKAESLKGGIYNIFMAKNANKNEKNEGILVHATSSEFYIKTAFGFVKYENLEGIKLPQIGSHIIVDFVDDKLLVQNAIIKHTQKHTL
jgi:hypothetical protein